MSDRSANKPLYLQRRAHHANPTTPAAADHLPLPLASPFLLVLLVLACAAYASSSETVPSGDRSTPAAPSASATAFVYEGELERHGRAAIGQFDLTFDLYDRAQGGSFLGRIERHGVLVDRGAFSVDLDFGTDALQYSAAPSETLWLEIQVRDAGATSYDSYQTMEPRQALNAQRGAACTVDGNLAVNGRIDIDPSSSLGLHVACCSEATLNGGGQIAVQSFLGALRIDNNEIQVQALGTAQPLYLNPGGGGVGVGHESADAPLHVVGSPDASPSGGGALVIGSLSGNNLAMDSNEIMARGAGGSTKSLFLNNDGGDVVFGGAIDIGYEVIIESGARAEPTGDRGGFTVIAQAFCSAGKKVIGGGCSGDGIITSIPSSGGTRWICVADSVASVRAICAKVK